MDVGHRPWTPGQPRTWDCGRETHCFNPFPIQGTCVCTQHTCMCRRVCTHTAHSGFSRVVLVTVRPLLAAVCPSFVLGHVAGPASHRGAGPILGPRGLEPRAGPGWLLSS